GRSMPPREQPSPQGKNRRRPDVMPGGWLWLVLLILLVIVILFTLGMPNANTIGYTEFTELARQGKNEDTRTNTNIKKVAFVGADRLEGEITDEKDVTLKDGKVNLRGRKFSTLIPASEIQRGKVSELLDANFIPYSRQDD